jgi:hypothetical protein
MSMAPGMSMPAASPATPKPADASTSGGPSQSARMICSDEIRTAAAAVVVPAKVPAGAATWANHLYTCTYRPSVGPLVLSVKESPNVAAARDYFAAQQQHLAPTKPIRGLAGLGLPAYETTTGTVVFLKDNKTLQVDATHLPTAIGPHHLSRTDTAYEIATDVLGCWTGK